MITDPLVGHIVQVNKSVIEKTADGTEGYEDASMISVSFKTYLFVYKNILFRYHKLYLNDSLKVLNSCIVFFFYFKYTRSLNC